ncbi:MAG TPA: DMT family transporter [Gemmatimonadales bacterium]|nr:DMT family transporter [Gemmatimonadales bacterium]
MSSISRARLQLIGAALLFSTGGAAIKAAAFTGWQIASFRSGFAALALLLVVAAYRRDLPRAPSQLARPALVGCAYAACLTLFVLANRLTTAANTIFLQSTAPLYVLVLAPWLLKEHVRRQDIGFMVVVALGLMLFFVGVDQPLASAPEPERGNLLAVISGFFWALTVCGLRWLTARPGRGSPLAAVTLGNFTAFLVTLPLALPLGVHSLAEWSMLVYLGVFQIALAYVLVTQAIPHVPALEASMILLIEPALNPLWAWLVQGEVPGIWAIVGGVMILGATTAKSWAERRVEAPVT